MTDQSSLIHPSAPEFLSAVALFSAPVDVEAAVARIRTLWNEEFDAEWEEVQGGRILRFVLEDVLVLTTPVASVLTPERGQLPEHAFHVAITCYAPLEADKLPGGGTQVAREPEAASGAGGDRAEERAREVDDLLPEPVRRRKRALASHVVLTELADALMREEAAVGLFRPDLGVVQPPEMVIELADLLGRGQAPLPLWVGVRTGRPGLAFGRTLGMPLFGHLDLEVVQSARTEEEIYAMLANIADYVIGSDTHILPGQSVGYREGDELAVSQAVSEADGAPVLRIDF
ncbi:MAG: DUF4261 domain-containing protein [Actinomycetaceae bacterium]|nr:DUF4261 domain-containing protein [Actinomycetaceae bacterium]